MFYFESFCSIVKSKTSCTAPKAILLSTDRTLRTDGESRPEI